MSKLTTLHPLDLDLLTSYLRAVTGAARRPNITPTAPAWSEQMMANARAGYDRARRGDERGANAVSYGLGQILATVHPSFVLIDTTPSLWESRIDRGLGMLLRPPSRLFGDAGLAPAAARAMPIRLDHAAGQMGGCYVPARLVPDLYDHLDSRAERLVRRLIEAELDGVAILALFLEAVDYARQRELGLYEAVDVFTREASVTDPPGATLIVPNRKRIEPALRQRLEEAAKPPKKPGLAARLFSRRRDA